MRYQLISPVVSQKIHYAQNNNTGLNKCYNELKNSNSSFTTFNVLNLDTHENFTLKRNNKNITGGANTQNGELLNRLTILETRLSNIEKKLMTGGAQVKPVSEVKQINEIKHHISESNKVSEVKKVSEFKGGLSDSPIKNKLIGNIFVKKEDIK